MALGQTPATCGGCDNTWTGLEPCHCSRCLETFGGIRGFDLHRSRGKCLHPRQLSHMSKNTKGHWVRDHPQSTP